MTSNEALKPCPLCASEQVTTAPDREWGDVTWSAICKSCGVQVTRDLEADAIKAWNTRSTDTPVCASTEEVEAVARALVPVMSGGQEDEFGRDLPDKQFDDLTPDWQEAFLGYARTAIEATHIEKLEADKRALVEALAEAKNIIGWCKRRLDPRQERSVDELLGKLATISNPSPVKGPQ